MLGCLICWCGEERKRERGFMRKGVGWERSEIGEGGEIRVWGIPELCFDNSEELSFGSVSLRVLRGGIR